jgi:hypothetical protein
MEHNITINRASKRAKKKPQTKASKNGTFKMCKKMFKTKGLKSEAFQNHKTNVRNENLK